jgi:wyosine [tRNA(Phe)-imidazoG37] synthetase (radical SAM superfamily)
METTKLQSGIVYGPVDSRRFGKSLGINILPDSFKVCSFDCVYCQYKDGPGKPKFHDFSEIYTQLLADFERIRDNKTAVDWIMLSGNGEPTLHPDFPDIVDGLLTLRDLYFPKTPLGILSNSSTCYKKEIREALSRLDGRFMKLDAGNLYMFHDVNRPFTTLAWGDVIEGLCNLPDVTLQSMFVTGKVDNTTDRAVDDWIEAIKCVRPLEVQIYTVDRKPQEAGIFPVEEEKLKAISDKLKVKTLIRSTVYY